jgi:hypothetical protein
MNFTRDKWSDFKAARLRTTFQASPERAYYDDRMEISFPKLCRRRWFYRIWSVPELSFAGT